jgi:hypothetical protein
MTEVGSGRGALSVGALMRDLNDGLVAHKREVLTVVAICYGPAVLANLVLSVSGALPTAADAAQMAVASTAWWSTVVVTLAAIAGLSFAAGASIFVVLRRSAPGEAARASLERWGGVLSVNVAGFLAIMALSLPVGALVAIGSAAVGAKTPEAVYPVMYVAGAIMFIPAVRTVLSLSTAFAIMMMEGLRLRPALVRAGELLKGNRLPAAAFFGSVVVVATGFPTAAVLVTGVDASSLAAIVVLSAIQIVAIAVEATALAVMYRALVGSVLGASDGKLAEVFE